MTTFDMPPADEDLRALADPDGASVYVRLDDDGTTLTGRPKGIPMWFVWVCLLVPAGIFVGALVWMNPFADPDPLTRAWGFLAALAIPVVLVGGPLVFARLNRLEGRRGDFFVFDRAAGSLTLPRAGVTLRRGDVAELVEIRAWRRVRYRRGRSDTYVHELSVLARGPGGTLTRYPVVGAGHGKPVARVADELAAAFGVPRRTLVEPLFFGRWRRADGDEKS